MSTLLILTALTLTGLSLFELGDDRRGKDLNAIRKHKLRTKHTDIATDRHPAMYRCWPMGRYLAEKLRRQALRNPANLNPSEIHFIEFWNRARS